MSLPSSEVPGDSLRWFATVIVVQETGSIRDLFCEGICETWFENEPKLVNVTEWLAATKKDGVFEWTWISGILYIWTIFDWKLKYETWMIIGKKILKNQYWYWKFLCINNLWTFKHFYVGNLKWGYLKIILITVKFLQQPLAKFPFDCH